MAGRPPRFENEAALQLEIENYFTSIKGEKHPETGEWITPPEPATITGLAYFLGFESRQSIYDYEKDGEFSYTIKRGRLRIENKYEQALTSGLPPAGAIFALKNFGWADKTEHATQQLDKNGLPIDPSPAVNILSIPVENLSQIEQLLRGAE